MGWTAHSRCRCRKRPISSRILFSSFRASLSGRSPRTWICCGSSFMNACMSTMAPPASRPAPTQSTSTDRPTSRDSQWGRQYSQWSLLTVRAPRCLPPCPPEKGYPPPASALARQREVISPEGEEKETGPPTSRRRGPSPSSRRASSRQAWPGPGGAPRPRRRDRRAPGLPALGCRHIGRHLRRLLRVTDRLELRVALRAAHGVGGDPRRAVRALRDVRLELDAAARALLVALVRGAPA